MEGSDRKPLVIDVGMNNGDDSAYYLASGCRVVGIEANPALAEQAAVRLRSHIERGDMTILNVAIAESDAVLPFWICDDHHEWSSFDRSVASRDGAKHHRIDVPCRRFRSVLERFGRSYAIKIDIEGHDLICAKDLDPCTLPKYLSVEMGDAVLQNLTLFRDLGFAAFKLINQRYFLPIERRTEKLARALGVLRDSRTLPVRALRNLGGRALYKAYFSRCRSLNGWTFPSGSSGPIGEDTKGHWQTFDEFLDTVGHFHKLRDAGDLSLHWRNESYSFWADIHMRS
jgi:FkbM family methyltransferase